MISNAQMQCPIRSLCQEFSDMTDAMMLTLPLEVTDRSEKPNRDFDLEKEMELFSESTDNLLTVTSYY
jgi:hypothetical protein